MQAKVKENNGGGLQIELSDKGEIVAVVTGIEYNDKANGLADLKGLVDGDWDYTDASQWYSVEGNNQGDKGEDGQELTAMDVVDDHESTKAIAEYDGKTMTINYDVMGHAGHKYFDPKN